MLFLSILRCDGCHGNSRSSCPICGNTRLLSDTEQPQRRGLVMVSEELERQGGEF